MGVKQVDTLVKLEVVVGLRIRKLLGTGEIFYLVESPLNLVTTKEFNFGWIDGVLSCKYFPLYMC